jgi:hypothetical protein
MSDASLFSARTNHCRYIIVNNIVSRNNEKPPGYRRLLSRSCKLLILNGGQRPGSNRRRWLFQGRLAKRTSLRQAWSQRISLRQLALWPPPFRDGLGPFGMVSTVRWSCIGRTFLKILFRAFGVTRVQLSEVRDQRFSSGRSARRASSAPDGR